MYKKLRMIVPFVVIAVLSVVVIIGYTRSDDGEPVRVFNDRGEIIIPVKVTERIMPGVVNINEGAWYKPDSKGIDRGGCANVLTKDEHSPAGSWTTNTCLVEVELTPGNTRGAE